MQILNDFNTTIQLDPIEWFDIEWHEPDETYRRVRVTEIKRNVYPAQGGGHGCVIFGTGLPYTKDGKLGKRQETVHRLSEAAMVLQIPPTLRTQLLEAGVFDDGED